MRIPLQPQILAKTAEFLPGMVTLQRAAMSSLQPGKQHCAINEPLLPVFTSCTAALGLEERKQVTACIPPGEIEEPVGRCVA